MQQVVELLLPALLAYLGLLSPAETVGQARLPHISHFRRHSSHVSLDLALTTTADLGDSLVFV